MKSLAASRAVKRLAKKSKKFRGYPVATIAFYGPDDMRASKVAVGIIAEEGSEADFMRRWLSDAGDVRTDPQIAEEVLDFMAAHGATSSVMSSRIIGCPHEEGIDYEGPTCPRCPFWAGRNRFTGEMEH